MKFSIITVTFNAERSLPSTLNSVRNQTYKDYELIVIDGKSTDNTLLIIETNKDIISYYVSEEDNGIYDAMNKGIQLSNGDYCIFLNAGDFFNNDLVLEDINHFFVTQEYKPDIVIGRAFYLNKSGKKSLFTPQISHVPYVFCHQSMVFNSSMIKRNTYDNDKYKFSGDSELLYRLLQQGYICKEADVIISVNPTGEGATYRHQFESAKELFSIPQLRSQLSSIYIQYRLMKVRVVVLYRLLISLFSKIN